MIRNLPALNHEKKWDFTPSAKAGDKVKASDKIGSVPEGIYEHYIMTPFDLHGQWEIVKIKEKGDYNIDEQIAALEKEGKFAEAGVLKGQKHDAVKGKL